MESKFTRVILTITTDLSGQRIDRVLPTLPEIATRSQAAKLLQAGRVRLAGRALKPSYQTETNDRIDIDIPLAVSSTLLPYDFPLQIVFEDDDLIVVDKPAGLVVHPACGHAHDTLVNALLHYTKDLSMGFNEERPGLVHRIDKGTSGLLVVAKHDDAQRFLAMQFQRKTTHRLYRALAFGKFKEDAGTIRSYVRRHPDNRKRMTSVPLRDSESQPEGKLAVTHYRVIDFHPSGVSLVELRLETGRTHQIRVHLSENAHPILGDDNYGATSRLKGLKSVQLRKTIEEMPRFALHAMELGFVHPRTKSRMIFQAPWPADLLALIRHFEFPMYHDDYVVQTNDLIASNDI